MNLRTLIAFSSLPLIFLFALRSVTAGDDCAFVGATVYPSPTGPSLPDAVVLTSGGKITAVGSRAAVKYPCLGPRHRLHGKGHRRRVLE